MSDTASSSSQPEELETIVDATRAAQLVSDLRALSRNAESVLEPDELQTISEVAEFLEDAACIETGELVMKSPVTDTKYRVTRWIDAGDGHLVPLAKEEIADEVDAEVVE